MNQNDELNKGEFSDKEEAGDNISAKEAYDARKAQRDNERAKVKSSLSLSIKGRKALIGILILIVLALIVYGLVILAQKNEPQGEDFSRAVEIMETSAHIDLDSKLPEYTSNPPTSGDHFAEPAKTGFRGDSGLPDGHFIHSMEHGNIWISYKGSVSEAVVVSLKELAGNRVVISQRDENEMDIAVASWGRLDTFDVGEDLTESDTQRIIDFIDRYTDRAPERIPSSAHSQGI